MLASDPAGVDAETARVLELTLPAFLDGRFDLVLRLYHRDGAFYHGYALLPDRDNLPHRIDPTPAAPFAFYRSGGERLEVKDEWMGTYSYKNDEWRRLREQYEKGDLTARLYDAPDPLAWDGTHLAGTLDVWLLPPDTANNWGLGPPKFPVRRIRLDAAARDGGALAGAFEAWQYEGKDVTYGAGADRFKGTVAGRWRDDVWEPRDGTAYAKGKDWPAARGPYLNGSAVDCGEPIVANLHDARLLWVAEELTPGGKGGRPKVDFGFYPANWSGIGYGAFGGPVVADGKVYAYFHYPDLETLRAIPEATGHILGIRGAPLGLVASHFDAVRHTVFCFDARTGKTLWRWRSEETFGSGHSGKSGKGLTPCVYNGRVYVRGGGIRCLDAGTGRLLWHRTGRDEKDKSYTSEGGWSRELSPAVIGGTLVFHIHPDTTLVGLDPETGEERWRHERACGWDAVPTRVVLDGRPYVATACGVDIRTEGGPDDERLLLIEPRSGNIRWQDRRIGKTGVALAVWDDIVCGNVTKGLSDAEGKGVDDRMRAGAFRVSLEGAEPLWTAEEVHYPPHRATPIAHRGHVYIDSRITGLACLDAATGRIVGTHPHIYKMTGGDHNWTWHAATDGRIVTSGLLLFTDAADGFRRLPGRLSLPLAGGYMCPIKPAIADGRLFVRTLDKLVCYDLRQPAGTEVTRVPLRFEQPYVPSAPVQAPLEAVLRIAGGRVKDGAVRPTDGASLQDHPRADWAPVYAHRTRLDGERLTGTLRVRVGFHEEDWEVDLARSSTWRGTYTRRIPPPAEPFDVRGPATGAVSTDGDVTLWEVTLEEAVTRDCRPDPDRVFVTLVLQRRGDGPLRAHAKAGRMNTAVHEVDASDLEVTGKAVRGRATVVFHADRWKAANAATRGAIAARYTLDARPDGDKVTGSYTGTVGVAWSRSGTVVEAK
jgi:outer membrane protein assembly factor BamB